MSRPQHPHVPPQPLDPVSPGDDPSEFGVPRCHQEALVRKGIAPEDGGPYRPKAPAMNPRGPQHQSGHPGRRVAR